MNQTAIVLRGHATVPKFPTRMNLALRRQSYVLVCSVALDSQCRVTIGDGDDEERQFRKNRSHQVLNSFVCSLGIGDLFC